MPLKIKTIRGRGYYYNDVSTRVNGRVKTTSTYIAPVSPKRSFRSKVRNIVSQLAPGIADLAARAAIGKLDQKPFKDRSVPYDRAARLFDDKVRALGHKFAVPDKELSSDGRRTGHFPSKGAYDEYRAGLIQLGAGKPAVEKVSAPPSPQQKADAAMWAEFNDRLKGHRAIQEKNIVAKQEAQKAPAPADVAPSTPAGPAPAEDTEKGEVDEGEATASS